MSVAVLIADMVRAGVDPELIGRTAEAFAENPAPTMTARQARNKRYYVLKRLKASEQDVSDVPQKEVPKPLRKTTISSDPKGSSGSFSDEPRKAFELWNVTAERCGLPVAQDLTPARRQAIAARLKTGGIDRWCKALAAVESSRFLTGQGEKIFRADLGFVCQQKSFQRLVEGFYGRDATPAKQMPETLTEAGWRSRIDHWQQTGEWRGPGPPPPAPDCLAPPALLAEHRAAA